MRRGLHQVVALILLGGGMFAAQDARAMDLAATGAWSTAITQADLVAGAGSNLQGSHDSGAGAIVLEVSLASGSTDAWRIDVRRTESVWDDSVHVWVRRTGSGSGDGSISDGLSWIELGATDTAFFSGQGDRSGVAVQVRISGISLSVSPDSYLCTVQYTLIDTL